MATINTNNTKAAMLVINAETKAPIELPLHIQEQIVEPIVNFQNWVKDLIRTNGDKDLDTKMLPGGKIKYYAYPKQTKADREMNISYDDTTGKINGGMFGAEKAGGLVGGVDSTYGSTLVSDEITLVSAKFLKHRFSNEDAKRKGLGNLTGLKLADWTAELSEEAFNDLKNAIVSAIGEKGKWATDASSTWDAVVPSGEGVRVLSKDYTDGKVVIDDIVKALIYRDKLGLKGTPEESYPLARGLNSSTSAQILLSADNNSLILKALEDSTNGWLRGVAVNKDTNLISSITYLGNTVKVKVVTDMPQKAAKDFNWLIIEVGKNGAMAMPNKFSNTSTVRPSYESISTEFSELEAVGLVAGLKFLQPELMWGSFKNT